MAAGIDLNAETADKPAETSAETSVDTKPEDAEVQSEAFVALTAQLSEAQASLATATTELETFKATAESLQANLDSQTTVMAGLADIVRATIKTMALPFNLETGAVAEMAVTDLAAKHKEISDLFKSKVKAGGVAAATRETKEEAEKQTQTATVNPLFLAAAQLNSLTKGK